RHTLTHTGGWPGDFYIDAGRGDEALKLQIAYMAGAPQVTPPGEVWSYSNNGFALAGRVIEVITGKVYEAAMQDLVLHPLGMHRSFFFPEDVMTYDFSQGHTTQHGEAEVRRPWALARVGHPSGALTSSTRDMLRYARFQMGDGSVGDGERLLSPASM